MRRFIVLLALIAVLVPILVNLSVAADEPVPLKPEKECVFIGRIQGSRVVLYPVEMVPEPVLELPVMANIKGFDVINTGTGEWQPLTLSEEGYFCANVGQGKYNLRGRDSDGKPYIIHSFNLPRGMAANLGTFWVETRNPKIVTREGWSSHVKPSAWRIYKEGSSSIALRLEHIATDEAYNDCDSWFAECHEEAYEQFGNFMARR